MKKTNKRYCCTLNIKVQDCTFLGWWLLFSFPLCCMLENGSWMLVWIVFVCACAELFDRWKEAAVKRSFVFSSSSSSLLWCEKTEDLQHGTAERENTDSQRRRGKYIIPEYGYFSDQRAHLFVFAVESRK